MSDRRPLPAKPVESQPVESQPVESQPVEAQPVPAAPAPTAAAGAGVTISPVGIVRAAPGLARVAATTSLHLATWGLGASTRGAGVVLRRAMAGEPAAAIVSEAADDLRAVAWRILGIPPEVARPAANGAAAGNRESTSSDLRRRGSELLRRSNDVRVVEDTHPAFARILSEITPDEARILRLFYLDGPQPAIDIRTNRPLGIGSVLVAGGMNMIAEHAGCRQVDRIHPYLTNLYRLGMIEFSKEQVTDPARYQVVEAQPNVIAALRRAGRMPKIVHRSIHLNSFGEEFCATCLPMPGLQPGQRRVPAAPVRS